MNHCLRYKIFTLASLLLLISHADCDPIYFPPDELSILIN